jgi:hypothetical protein
MIRNIIIRTFLAGAALVGLAVVAVAVAGYMALQQPEFYSELRKQAEAPKTAEEELKQIALDFKRWNETSAALQRAESSNSTYDPLADIHSVSVTETQMNAVLASQRFGAGDVQHPRVKLLNDNIRIAAEYCVDTTTFVVSVALKPAVMSGEKLHLDIMSAHLGNLPIPLKTLTSWVPKDADLSSGQIQFDLTGSTPRLIVEIAGRNRKSPTVRSLQCAEGALTIDFQAIKLAEATTEMRLTQDNGVQGG